MAAKHRAKVSTFREAATQTFETNRARWRNGKVPANWLQQMEKHVFPRIGNRPVDQISRDEVLTNVAGEGIDGALPTQPAVKAHFRALPYREVAAALDTVEASGASLSSKLCFRLLILTAARSGEARGAAWDEIDLGAKEWRFPPSA